MLEYALFMWLFLLILIVSSALFHHVFRSILIDFLKNFWNLIYITSKFCLFRKIMIIKKWANFCIPVNEKFKIKFKENVYVIDLKKSIPNDAFKFLVVLNEYYDDVSTILIQEAGPFANFMGLEKTPKSFGWNSLIVNDQIFSENDKIPCLLEFLN